MSLLLLRAFTVAVTTPAPQASRSLPSVDPNVAKALTIVALSQTTFGPISIYINDYVGEVRYFK
jgi:hypothetical protein